jgi:hypothetical protein
VRGQDRGATAVDLFVAAEAADAAGPATASRWRDDGDGPRRLDAPPTRLATALNRRPAPVLLGRHGGGIDFDLELPAGARLQADIGLPQVRANSRQIDLPQRLRYWVSLRREGEPDFAEIASWPAPGGRPGWRALELDLAPYAGQRVTLRLGISCTQEAAGELAWWGSPRIVTAP